MAVIGDWPTAAPVTDVTTVQVTRHDGAPGGRNDTATSTGRRPGAAGLTTSCSGSDGVAACTTDDRPASSAPHRRRCVTGRDSTPLKVAGGAPARIAREATVTLLNLGATVLITWIAMLTGAWYVHRRNRED